MADEAPDFGNEDKAGVDATSAIEDGQTGSGLRAKVDTDALGYNRLYVQVGGAQGGDPVPIIPLDDVHHFKRYLLNSGSNAMNVNGAVSPVVFSEGPAPGEKWYLESMNIFISDTGTTDVDDFGAITGGLTNGVLLEVVRNGVAYEMDVLFTNRDVVTTFHEDINSGGANTSSGYLNEGRLFFGQNHFEPPLTLVGDDGDVFRATVRDDLAPLDFLNIATWAWRVI